VSDKTNLDREFAFSVAGLLILLLGGILAGALIDRAFALGKAGPQQVVLTLLVVLVLFALVTYVVALRPLKLVAAREAVIEQVRTTDALTGLMNRGRIVERLEREISRAWRRGEPLACAIVDIEGFRRINDEFGREAGDSILSAVARIIADSARQYDSAGRYDGDKFLLVFPETRLDDAARACERLRRRVASHEFACDGKSVAVTVSIGVTQAFTEGMEKTDTLLRRAEEALARAKSEGGDRVYAAAPLAVVEQDAASETSQPAD